MRRYLIWALATLFYLYEYILRVAPSVMTNELMSSFSISAGQLGLLTAFYLYAYAPMQLPVGMLMDRYGPRRLLTFASSICGVGSLLFAFSPDVGLASIGRLFMGCGSAFAFVGVVYLCSHLFEKSKLALLVGIANSFGMLGAFGGQGPLSVSIEKMGWRLSSQILGYIGFTLALVIFFSIKKTKKKLHKESSVLGNLKTVCSCSQTWINSIIALFFYASTAAFGGLWCVPFLSSAHGLSTQAAGFATSMIYLGWIFGGPIIGLLSDKMNKRRPSLMVSILLSLAALLAVIYIPTLSITAIYILLFVAGFFLSTELLCYSLSIELNPSFAKGTAVALTNFMVFLASSVLQPLVGYMIQIHWDGATTKGVPVYTASDYRFALIVFPITLVLAFITCFFLKESKRHKDAVSSY